MLMRLTACLLLLEITSFLAVRTTAAELRKILLLRLEGRAMEDLDESESERVWTAANAEYDRTIYRKIDLVVIAYHLPALASWVGLTGRNTTPTLHYYAVTMAFWFAVFYGFIVLCRF